MLKNVAKSLKGGHLNLFKEKTKNCEKVMIKGCAKKKKKVWSTQDLNPGHHEYLYSLSLTL